MQLFDNQGATITVQDPIAETVGLLKAGRILAIKGLGGFHLVVDAENQTAVTALRERKNREEKPLAVMSFDLAVIRQYAMATPDEEQLLLSPQRPIVLLPKKEPAVLAEGVSPNSLYYGVMLPYTPLHYLLLKDSFRALVMTSGNMSEEPIAIDNQDALERLRPWLIIFCYTTVIFIFAATIRWLKQSMARRGFFVAQGGMCPGLYF